MKFRYALLAVVPLSALAVGQSMQPGMWEYTTKIEMPGMPVAIPPAVFKQCLTQEQIDENAQYKNKDQKDCKLKNLKESGNSVSYDIECTGDHPTTGHFDFTVTKTSMKGKGTMKAEGRTMGYQMEAKRVGDCK